MWYLEHIYSQTYLITCVSLCCFICTLGTPRSLCCEGIHIFGSYFVLVLVFGSSHPSLPVSIFTFGDVSPKKIRISTNDVRLPILRILFLRVLVSDSISDESRERELEGCTLMNRNDNLQTIHEQFDLGRQDQDSMNE